MPESLLTEKSEYFTAACRGEWTEATTRTIKLQDINVEAFGSYVFWVHRGELAVETKIRLDNNPEPDNVQPLIKKVRALVDTGRSVGGLATPKRSHERDLHCD